MRRSLVWGVTLLHAVLAPRAVEGQQPEPTLLDPATAIFAAFRTNDVVALTDPHGNEQVQQFLLSLIRDARFAEHVNDVVLEPLSARHQDVVDRYVRGDAVDHSLLRKAWEEHTVVNSLGFHTEQVLAAIRSLNSSLPGSRHVRVIAGDPPIDWDHIVSRQDHWRWVELRTSHPADLIRRHVLDRGRKALLVYGQGHLVRQQVATNYDMSAWQAQTVVSLLQRDHRARVFTVWTLNRPVALPVALDSWHAPGLLPLRGSSVGALDFALFAGGPAGNRVGMKDGRMVPVPREEWKVLPMEEQFDALLYLGPPSAMTMVTVPRALCEDTAFVDRRIDRLARFGPRPELDEWRRACGR